MPLNGIKDFCTKASIHQYYDTQTFKRSKLSAMRDPFVITNAHGVEVRIIHDMSSTTLDSSEDTQNNELFIFNDLSESGDSNQADIAATTPQPPTSPTNHRNHIKSPPTVKSKRSIKKWSCPVAECCRAFPSRAHLER